MQMQQVLLGIAIGDAFGAGVEFQDRTWIQQHVDFSRFVNARHQIQVPDHQKTLFTQNYHPWEYTDDTEMTVGLIKALLSKKAFSPDLLIDHWTQEYQLGITQKGYGRNGHGSMRWVFSGEKSIEEVRAFQTSRKYPGNAPPMRAVPLGCLPAPLIDDYAIINADATHPHPIARAASILVARATAFLLVKKGQPADLIAYCQRFIKEICTDTYELLQDIAKLPPPTQLQTPHYETLCGPQPIKSPRFLAGIHGLPSDALLTGGAILYILKHAKSAFEALKLSINLGGDVDSVASICTGILAGKYGLASLPDFMLEKVEGKAMLVELGTKFQQFVFDQI
ncbi:MAG: ADP-ribosylglycohydrolase family protein [Flammeovirgaceae bacterium]